MKKLKVYYAHFMGIFNTPQEKRDIEMLERLGLEVVNPNTPGIQAQVKKQLKIESYMSMFNTVFFFRVRNCEVFAFRPLPDGRIPGGIAMELKVAQEWRNKDDSSKIIIELPCGIHSRSMGKEDTREYLENMGER